MYVVIVFSRIAIIGPVSLLHSSYTFAMEDPAMEEDPVMEEVPVMEEDQDPTTEEDYDSDLSGEDSNFEVMDFLANMASNEEVNPETWERLMEEQGQAVFEESESFFLSLLLSKLTGALPNTYSGKKPSLISRVILISGTKLTSRN